MVTHQINAVLKQAITTFSCKKDVFYQNLELLRSILDKTTASDVNLNPQFMSAALWKRPNKAPVTYIDIFEDEIVTIGIFILKPDMKLPLHDHPQMHGLIKVLSGTIKVTSFSLNTENTAKLGEKQMKCSINSIFPTTVMAERNSDIVADSSSECCVLEHNRGNIHEIESVGGPAAFLDILSPPYETEIENNGLRKCTYYKIIKEITPQVFKLEETNSPVWFWNDSCPYTGPELHM